MNSRPYIYAAIAAAAMVATLPGRTHGLGLITEPLMRDLAVERVPFATINFWATLIGAAFCLPCGWLIDRFGVRAMLVAVMVPLGAVVVAMSRLQAGAATVGLPDFEHLVVGRFVSMPVPADLFALVLLTRGLGQSALSVVSLALIGKVAGGKAGPVMGVYSFVSGVGFFAAYGSIKAIFDAGAEWRMVWMMIGIAIIAGGIAAGLFVRNPVPQSLSSDPYDLPVGHTLGQSLRTMTFWVFALSTSLYGLIAAGVSLFNQSILEERGFNRNVFLTISTFGPMVGLAANLLTGWLSSRISLGPLLALAMAILASSLFVFPFVTTLVGVYSYAVTMGVAGGMITVLFFTVWGQAFGQSHLGKIQGAAQLLTVLASAAGPLMLAIAKREANSYLPLFFWLACVSLGFAVVALFTHLPNTRLPKRSP